MSLRFKALFTTTLIVTLGYASLAQAQDNPFPPASEEMATSSYSETTTSTPVSEPVLKNGFYLGAALGGTYSKIDTAGLNNPSKDESNVGGKFFGGYRLHRNIAVELGYVDLGKISVSDNTGNATFKFKDGAELSAVGILPVSEKLGVYGRAGMYSLKTKLNVNANNGASGSVSKRNEGLLLGVGANYALTQDINLRGEWERFNKVGDESTTGTGDIDFVSVGMSYQF